MINRTFVAALISAGLLAGAGSPTVALASSDDRIASIAEFLEAQHQLRTELEQGKYGRISPHEMDLLESSQQTIFSILGRVDSIDQLDRDERIAVFNAQETVNAILTDNLDHRPICRREHTVGTNRRVVSCFTPAQRREMREMAERTWHWANHSHLVPPTDG